MYSIDSLPSPYELENCTFVGGSTSTKGVEASRKTTASKISHREAERRRRKRINGHLDTLRTLLPDTVKTDKATLLTEVVRHLRELKSTTESNNSQFSMSPTETDLFQLCRSNTDSNIVIATICCDDRPMLIADLAGAVRAAEGNVVRAEMETVGGKTKVVLWVKCSGEEGMVKLGRGLKVVFDKTALCNNLGQGIPDHKRPRYSHGL